MLGLALTHSKLAIGIDKSARSCNERARIIADASSLRPQARLRVVVGGWQNWTCPQGPHHQSLPGAVCPTALVGGPCWLLRQYLAGRRDCLLEEFDYRASSGVRTVPINRTWRRLSGSLKFPNRC